MSEAYAKTTSEQYDRRLAEVVHKLRNLADYIEIKGKPMQKAYGSMPRHMKAAEDAQFELLWGIANLNALYLTEAAYEADRAEQEVAMGGE